MHTATLSSANISSSLSSLPYSKVLKDNAGRKRTVFNSHELPHLWAHKAFPSGKCRASERFDGDVYYSYAAPIAACIDVVKGKGNKAVTERVYLISDRRYSITTSGHQSGVQFAIPFSAKKFHVPQLFTLWDSRVDYARVTGEFATRIADLLEESNKSREPKKSRLLTEAQATEEKAREFAEFFGVKGVKIPKVPATTVENAAALAKAAARAEAARVKRERTRAAEWEAGKPAREAAEREALAEAEVVRAAWAAGEMSYLPFRRFTTSLPTILRVRDGEVETSGGASFPVSHAKRGLQLVRAVMSRGEEWRTNGHTCHLGHYKIERITPDGTVYAGCHVVPFSSIEAIAPQLDAAVVSEGEASNA